MGQFWVQSNIVRDWLFFISPRSQIVSSLSTRIADIERVEDYQSLDNVALKKGSGEDLELISPDPWGYNGSVFFLNKSRIVYGNAGGIVTQLSEKELFFLGVRDELPILAAKQDFKQIIAYENIKSLENKEIDCVVSKARFREFHLPANTKNEVYRTGNYYKFRIKGDLCFER